MHRIFNFLVHRIFAIFILLAIHAGNGAKIEMKCMYHDLTGWYNVGPACDLQTRGAISMLNAEDTVEFTGLTDSERQKIRAIVWRTGDVDFIPREAFSTFPNLDCIAFHDAVTPGLGRIDASFFRFFPENHKINYFYFWNCKINMIDPVAWEYLKTASRFNFNANTCLNGEYRDVIELSRKIQPCLKNYMESSLFLHSKVERMLSLGGSSSNAAAELIDSNDIFTLARSDMNSGNPTSLENQLLKKIDELKQLLIQYFDRTSRA
jgi:hypothetical protein